MTGTRTIIMIGDITGEAGLNLLKKHLSDIRKKYEPSIIVVNGENSCDGFGMTESDSRRIFESGADVISSGNHIWEKRDFIPYMESENRILRPANYYNVAGRGSYRVKKDEILWNVLNLQGREFMSTIDCPFRCFDTFIESESEHCITIVDFHGESGREKEAFAFYADGRASVIAGTHTHVATSDERVLPRGTAYITDIGMTGAHGGVIGMTPDTCIIRAKTQILYKLECSSEFPTLQGIVTEIDIQTRKAVCIERIKYAM